ncbi:MAG: twin-arginine translocation signal domain-containing protein, partial [Planctomycetota bacterium]
MNEQNSRRQFLRSAALGAASAAMGMSLPEVAHSA